MENASFPSWERGLKSLKRRRNGGIVQSFPSWERGLKLRKVWREYTGACVVPLVGTWIEISKTASGVTANKSFPSWERGLKSAIVTESVGADESFPSWERGLKSQIGPLRLQFHRRSPRGNVD